MAGAVHANYTIAHADLSDAGIYTVMVGNPAGSVTSNSARVSVGSTITSNPLDLSVPASQSAILSASAGGNAPFTWQWFRNGTPISGAIAAVYTTPPLTLADTASHHYVTATDTCGTGPLTSTSANLSVTATNAPPFENGWRGIHRCIFRLAAGLRL